MELFQPPIGAAEKGKTSITGYYVKIEGPWKAIKIKGYNPRTENAPDTLNRPALIICLKFTSRKFLNAELDSGGLRFCWD